MEDFGDIHITWKTKQEKKRIVVDFDGFSHLLESGELFSRKTMLKLGECLFDKAELTLARSHDNHGKAFVSVTLFTQYSSNYKYKMDGIGGQRFANIAFTAALKSGDAVLYTEKSKCSQLHPSIPRFFPLEDIVAKNLDYVRVIVDLIIYSEGSCSTHQGPSAASFPGEVLKDLGKALESGQGTDVTFKIPRKTGGFYPIKAHTSILGARSTVFAAMFNTENGMLEAKTKQVLIEDMTLKGMQIFLKYLYTGEISGNWMTYVEELLDATEKYNVVLFKTFFDEKLIYCCNELNVFKMHKLAKKYNLAKAEKAIAEYAIKNAKILSCLMERM